MNCFATAETPHGVCFQDELPHLVQCPLKGDSRRTQNSKFFHFKFNLDYMVHQFHPNPILALVRLYPLGFLSGEN